MAALRSAQIAFGNFIYSQTVIFNFRGLGYILIGNLFFNFLKARFVINIKYIEMKMPTLGYNVLSKAIDGILKKSTGVM